MSTSTCCTNKTPTTFYYCKAWSHRFMSGVCVCLAVSSIAACCVQLKQHPQVGRERKRVCFFVSVVVAHAAVQIHSLFRFCLTFSFLNFPFLPLPIFDSLSLSLTGTSPFPTPHSYHTTPFSLLSSLSPLAISLTSRDYMEVLMGLLNSR